jgi:nitric oxide reductase subunit B
MGAAYYLVPEESRVELHSVRLAYLQLAIWTAMGVTAVVGYVFRWTAGNKLLEQPFPLKVVIVVVMLMFLYNIGMTIRAGGRLTTTEGVLVGGLACSALLYLPALVDFDNYTVSVFYRWWTVHLWVEGVWEMIQGALLAYLLIRLSGVDREVLEKWLYVIVGLTFISGILGTAHHYYWIGVPRYWLPIGGFFSALEPAVFLGMAMYAYYAIRRSGLGHPNRMALHWTIGSAIFSALGAGLLGLAHTWPAVNKWTHGTLITPMHGHMAFFGAYVMIVLGMITYAMPGLTGRPEDSRETPAGFWSFWLQLAGMFGMTMAFAAAGITQTYLERILGIGYLETQLKLQVHFLMLVAAGALFTAGVALYLWDFFFLAGRPVAAPAREGLAPARTPAG